MTVAVKVTLYKSCSELFVLLQSQHAHLGWHRVIFSKNKQKRGIFSSFINLNYKLNADPNGYKKYIQEIHEL